MPIYSRTITVPANRPEEDPVIEKITLNQRFITRMEVFFPDGCANLVKCRIMYGIKQFWPEEPGTWLVGNGETISWEERFEMPAVGEELTIIAASPGTLYPHTIVVRIMTLPRGFFFLETLLQRLKELFERII
jgi:hypothetical protein